MPTPPTLYHVEIFYNQTGDRSAGWTLNFWNDASDDPTIIARTNRLSSILNKLAGVGCFVQKARYSQVPAFRVADEILYAYKAGTSTNPDLQADYQTTAVGIRLKGAGKYGVNIWISGNDDIAVTNAGRLSPNFKADVDFKRLQAYLVSGGDGWVLRVKNKTRPSKLVSGITNAGTVTCPAHGFDGTSTVVISRIKGAGRPRGSWRITNITTNTFDLVGYGGPAFSGAAVRNTIAREDIYIATGIAEVKPVRATSHKRGKPSGLLTGKSKKPA